MSARLLSLIALAATLVPLTAQGRGGPDEFLERYACYFVDTKIPVDQGEVDSKARLASIPMVKDAKEKGHLAFLYLYDSSADEPKREGFDKIIFGNQDLGIALRCFRCARIDIAGDTDAQAKFGRKLPLFITYDDKGKQVGETSLPGYKAALRSLTSIVENAATGHVKPNPANFTKTYRDILRDLRVLKGRRSTLEGRRNRAGDNKRAQFDKEFQELDAQEKRLLEHETKTLELANPPPRDPAAKMLGAAQRRER